MFVWELVTTHFIERERERERVSAGQFLQFYSNVFVTCRVHRKVIFSSIKTEELCGFSKKQFWLVVFIKQRTFVKLTPVNLFLFISKGLKFQFC